MSPVHVIVGSDPRAEAMWTGSFSGAVDLYRFDRNVDAFERLTAAEAAVDLVILTPAQHGPFNLTPDQFVARVLEGPLASAPHLANLHVIVVGEPLVRSHPRAMSVSTLEAAIRLVKFGEVERRPAQAPIVPVAPAPAPPAPSLGELPFSGSVISRIWDAPAPRAAAPTPVVVHVEVTPPASAEPAAPVEAPMPVIAAPVSGGGAASSPQLFARTAAPSFVLGGGAGSETAPAAEPASAMQAPIGAPHEAIEVGTGVLQAARPYQLPNGAGYRGPAVRGGTTLAASHGHPVPPALGSQVQAMVYAGQIGNPNDPLLTWCSGTRSAAAPAPGQSVPVPMPAQPAPPSRSVPLEPPTGVYGATVPQPAPVDPFLARAERDGGVAFG